MSKVYHGLCLQAKKNKQLHKIKKKIQSRVRGYPSKKNPESFEIEIVNFQEKTKYYLAELKSQNVINYLR